MTKVLAILVGMILAATSAYALTSTVGGIDTVAGRTIIALALGVVMGSIVVGTLADRKTATVILVAMAAGELYSLAGTAERVMVAREAQQAPLLEAGAKHDAAAKGFAEAQAAKPVPASHDRIDAAEAAQRAAQEAVRASAAAPGCKKNCADLLQAQADAAGLEVMAARRELKAHDEAEAKRISVGITAAQAAFDAAPIPANVSPLANFLHITPRTLDLTMAAALSLGLNGMAAALIAVGSHGIHSRTATPARAKPKLVSDNTKRPTAQPVGSVSKWMLGATKAQPSAKTEWGVMLAAYRQWCHAHGLAPVTASEFAESLNVICERTGIETKEKGSKVYCLGLALAS